MEKSFHLFSNKHAFDFKIQLKQNRSGKINERRCEKKTGTGKKIRKNDNNNNGNEYHK